MFCTECGSKIDDDSIFCPECGTKMDSSSDVTEVIEEKVSAVDKTQAMPPVQASEPALTSSPQSVSNAGEGSGRGVNKTVLIGGIIAGIIIVALVAILIVVLVVLPSSENASKSSASSSIQSSQNVINTSDNSNVSNENIANNAAESNAGNQATTTSDYLLPNSNTTYLSQADLMGMTDRELYLARNEIYARLGRQFKNVDLQQYFNGMSWYQPLYSPEEFDSKGPALNDYERKNAELIMSVEKSHNSPYLN